MHCHITYVPLTHPRGICRTFRFTVVLVTQMLVSIRLHLCQTLFTRYLIQFFAAGFQILKYGDHGQDLHLKLLTNSIKLPMKLLTTNHMILITTHHFRDFFPNQLKHLPLDNHCMHKHTWYMYGSIIEHTNDLVVNMIHPWVLKHLFHYDYIFPVFTLGLYLENVG